MLTKLKGAKQSFLCALILVSLLSVVRSTAFAEQQTLLLTAEHAIMPASQNSLNPLKLKLVAPFKAEGYRAIIRSESGMARLASNEKGLFMEQFEMQLHPDKEEKLSFRWSGPAPTSAPFAERVLVSIPELNLTGKADISVGIDLDILRVEQGQEERGGAVPIHVFIQDRFHPNAPLQELLDAWEIRPGLRLVLLENGKELQNSGNNHSAVNRFFGTTSAIQRIWPATEPETGTVRAEGKEWVWVSHTKGQRPYMQRLGGTFQVQAFLWPNTGAAGIRNARSEPFALNGAALSFNNLPPFYSWTLEMLQGLNPEGLPELKAMIEQLLAEKKEDQAAGRLGKEMRARTVASPQQTLGRYSDALLATAPDPREAIRFLRAFSVGYTGHGILIFSHAGLASSKGGPKETQLTFTDASKELTPKTASAQARFFRGPKFTVIPFAEGELFFVRLKSNAKYPVSLWKVLPQGINSKEYPAKDWEKEIAVYGDRLTPPAPRKN